MLIELFGRNFGCFRDEFRLSLLATDIDPESCRGVVEVRVDGDQEPVRLLRTAAIYGPNASGKSTVLHAAHVLGLLLEESAQFRSDQPLGPYRPFRLDSSHRDAACTLGVRGILDRIVYEYAIEFDNQQVRTESLNRLHPTGSEVLFSRIGEIVEGAWTDEPHFGLLKGAYRPNALLLSLADAIAPKLASGVAVGLRRLLGFFDPTLYRPSFRLGDPVADRAATDSVFGDWLRCRLRDVDIGVVDYNTEEITDQVRRYSASSEGSEEGSRRKSFRLELFHDSTAGPVALPPFRESKGTRRFLDLTPYFFDLAQAEAPRAFFVDEIDASLHPTLLNGLVRHFNCDLGMSEVRGQLIFATHETQLMDDEARHATLRRDQIYFTEKDTGGAARLYPLSDFGERNNVNIRRRYLQGRFGALPSLGDLLE